MVIAVDALISRFEGIASVQFDAAEIDNENGGVFPATISVQFTPDSAGFYALEFIIWALGDIRQAGADIHWHLASPPPWLNEPGKSMTLYAYINPRSANISAESSLIEITEETAHIVSFLSQVHQKYWSLCYMS